MKKFIATILLAISAAGSASAQSTDAQFVARLRARPQVTVEAGCKNKPAWVVGLTAAGAVGGWLIHTFTIGLFAADHGSVYKRERNQFMIGGALLGLGIGLFDALTQECIRPPRRL